KGAAAALSSARCGRVHGHILAPHPSLDTFARYTAIAADLLAMLAVCGAQTLLCPNLGLPASGLPLFAVLITLFLFSEGVYRAQTERVGHTLVLSLARSVSLAAILVAIGEHERIGAGALLTAAFSSLLALLAHRQLWYSLATRRNGVSAPRNVL